MIRTSNNFLSDANKKGKQSSINRLPSLYTQLLVKSENEYQREISRKLDQLQCFNRDTQRRRHAYDHLFTHGHLSKRRQWFNLDKSYRDTCRTTWNKETMNKNRTSHIFVPTIYSSESSSFIQDSFEIQKNEHPVITDEKIKRKFLHIQPVMLEILNAPHSSKLFKHKHGLEMRKISAQRRQKHIQTNATDDPRYRQLVSELQNN
ncbi:unnamed protein product [Rotaria sordida]|uniref:Uncharacterized protein n=1 Tax=Rotaria sordida TaxID=392033 RepID=A0A815MJ88_9BILA|nr:unnamed protein product [Rotaria sordida]CAF1425287.1 unnamed protein product [Rotaria sordida]